MQTPTIPQPTHRPDPALVRRAVAKRSYATLATTSPAGRPHAAGISYQLAGSALYVSTMRDSRKARNIAANPHVGLVIPVRRLPIGLPSAVQFQTTARILDLDDPELVDLVNGGSLPKVSSHGELDLPGGCFLRIALSPRLITYGLGMPIRKLIADPLDGGGLVELEPAS
jgi:hypothetical protein